MVYEGIIYGLTVRMRSIAQDSGVCRASEAVYC